MNVLLVCFYLPECCLPEVTSVPKVSCSCGKKYTVPESALGRRARCRQCGEVFELRIDNKVDEVPELIDLDGLARGSATERSPADDHAASYTSAPQPFQQEIFPDSSTATDFAKTEGNLKSYFASLPRVFVFFSSRHNVVTFVVVWLVLTVGHITGGFFAAHGFIILAPLTLLVTDGAFAAFSFNTVHQSSDGENDLPAFLLTLNLAELWGAVIVPFLAFSATYLLAVAPAIVYLILVVVATPVNAPIDMLDLVPAIGLLLLGLFLWPMLILSLALGGARTMFRFGSMSATILTTFPAYVCTVLLVYSSGALLIFVILALPEGDTYAMVIAGVANGALVYVQIVAMRAIGAYYYNFQRKFGWL